MQRSRII